ncbi:histone-lysine N-methyltransferase SETMAR [Trichonephila clavipes]|nr:histone-lysine N-methyltransferase SETMAR [Trichonephila clavipes]
MDQIEYRAIIKYLFLKDNTPTQIQVEMDYVYGDSAPSFATVKFWAAKFKRSRKSLGDDERSGRPNTATTDGTIVKVHQMGLDDPRTKVRDIAEVMNMAKGRVSHILNQHLGMRKLSARWVSHLLTLGQKRVRKNISNALLAQFRRVLEPITYCRGNLDTPLYARNKNTVPAVGYKGGTGSKKSKSCLFGRESDGDCFLG